MAETGNARRYAKAATLALALSLPASHAWGDEDNALQGDGPNLDDSAAVVAELGGHYSAEATLTQVIEGNTLIQAGVTEANSIVNAFSNGSGIIMVNQDSGNFNNQANITAIAIGGSAEGTLGQLSAARSVTYSDNQISVTDAKLENKIENSFNNTAGITSVNQSAGAMNSQANVVVVGIGLEGGGDLIALSDSMLAVESSNNEVEVEGTFEAKNSVTNSFNGYSGVAQVNQVAGYGNVTGQVLGITLNTVNLP